MRLEVFCEDRLGLTRELLDLLVLRSIDLRGIEIDPVGRIYLNFAEIEFNTFSSLMAEIRRIAGVTDVRTIPWMPSEREHLALSALLEAMQERQVTIGDNTYSLPQPFLVLATQNPLEQEGTYPLPEAQVDRFMLKAKISYPKKQEERDIVRMNLSGAGMPQVNKVISPEDIIKARKVVEDVYMDEKIEKYIIDIIFATREPAEYNLQKLQNLIAYGGSPRASISLAKAARAYAFIRRRGYVIPEDVRAVCHDVLRHRIGLTYEAEAENITSEEIITDILNNVIVP